jgi:AAHS family 4-hydroxybenzoate transporter-like MFS transporter
LSPLQIRVAVLCGLVAMLDGFDTQSIAYVAPSIASSWHLNPAVLGPIFSAGLLGLAIGALALSSLADRYGRRVVILFSVFAFGVFALLTARAESLGELAVFRLLTGIGLGGAMPNIIALTSEYAPADRRGTVVTAMFCGFPLGATIGGFLSAPLIHSFGWQSVFVVGGLTPLVLLLVLLFWLPESVRGETSLTKPRERFPVLELFSEGRARRTGLVWVAFFMNLLVMYFLTNWLPSLLNASGMSLNIAIWSTALLNLGGVAGGLSLGRLIDRHNPYLVLGTAYAGAAVCIVAIALSTSGFWLLLFALLAGFGVSGAQIGLNAVTAAAYPAAIRSTGIGWALGVGRVGSILGPAVGGILLGLGWTNQALLLAAVLPAMIASAAVLGLRRA